MLAETMLSWLMFQCIRGWGSVNVMSLQLQIECSLSGTFHIAPVCLNITADLLSPLGANVGDTKIERHYDWKE